MAISLIPAASAINGTLPVANGGTGTTVLGPAFSAYISTNQAVSQNVETKAAFDTEVFDTASCFNTSTNRFTPNVAGYYQVNLNVFSDYVGSYSAGGVLCNIYKNGSRYAIAQMAQGTSGYAYGGYSNSAIVYMYGTTDYLEGYGRNPNPTGSAVFGGGATVSTFSACLVRTA